jgi:hypothetical protein
MPHACARRARQVMTKSLDYAREIAAARGLEVHAAAASNGVLSRQQLDWIVGNRWRSPAGRKHWPEFEGECEVRPMFEPGMGP